MIWLVTEVVVSDKYFFGVPAAHRIDRRPEAERDADVLRG